MKRKIIITEEQAQKLAIKLKENSDYDSILQIILDDLNLNYEPIMGTYRQGGEYFEKPMIKVKADGEMINPKDLLIYLVYKHKSASDKFLKQVILDWVNGHAKDGQLTKNINLNERRDYQNLIVRVMLRQGRKPEAFNFLTKVKKLDKDEAHDYISKVEAKLNESKK